MFSTNFLFGNFRSFRSLSASIFFFEIGLLVFFFVYLRLLTLLHLSVGYVSSLLVVSLLTPISLNFLKLKVVIGLNFFVFFCLYCVI